MFSTKHNFYSNRVCRQELIKEVNSANLKRRVNKRYHGLIHDYWPSNRGKTCIRRALLGKRDSFYPRIKVLSYNYQHPVYFLGEFILLIFNSFWKRNIYIHNRRYIELHCNNFFLITELILAMSIPLLIASGKW